jgi:hypothetical protein
MMALHLLFPEKAKKERRTATAVKLCNPSKP